MGVSVNVEVMEGMGVTVAVSVEGSSKGVLREGEAVSVAVDVGAPKTIPLHPTRSVANRTMTVMR